MKIGATAGVAGGRLVAILALIAMMMIGFAGVSKADHGTSWSAFGLSAGNGNAEFSGHWKFWPKDGGPAGQGGFGVKGNLCDNNGSGAYGQGRVEGYGWSSNTAWTAKSGCTYKEVLYYDHQARTVNQGRYRICNQVSLWPDQCAASPWRYHH